jgi:hypothetical protein
MTTEGNISKAILEYLTLVRRYFCWRNNTGGFRDKRDHYYQFGKVGSGDILGLDHKGRFFSIEVKAPGKNPTEHQEAFIYSVNATNGMAFVARSIDDVIAQGL